MTTPADNVDASVGSF